MTRLIFHTATTLDGYLADEADSLEWLFTVPDSEAGTAGMTEFLAGVGVLIMGSTTYQWVYGHEDLASHPEKWAEYYGDRPTWVFTTRDLPLVAGSDIRFASGDVRHQWPAVTAAAGDRDVWIMGGGDLVGQFADAGLLDQIVVNIAPVTLGAGRPLLPRRLESDRLTLSDVRRNGPFAQLTYEVSG